MLWCCGVGVVYVAVVVTGSCADAKVIAVHVLCEPNRFVEGPDYRCVLSIFGGDISQW